MVKIKNFFKRLEHSSFTYAIWLVVFFSFSIMYTFCRDTDLLWHIKIGEEVFANKTVSLSDTFSWQGGLVWYQQEWLFGCFIYLISLLPDLCFELLFILNSTSMIIFGMWCSKPSSKLGYVLVAVFLFAFIPSNHANRPSEFSVWMVVGMLYILMGQLSWIKKSVIMFLGGVLISNFHAACILPLFGFGFLLFVAEIMLCLRKKGESRRLFGLPVSYVFFIAGTFFCPCGVSLYSHLLTVTGTQSTRYISEWVPWEPGVAGFFIIVISLASLFFSFSVIWNDARQFRSLFVWLGGFGLTCLYGCKGGTFLLLLSLFMLYPYIELLGRYCISSFAFLKRVEEYGFVFFIGFSLGVLLLVETPDYTPFLAKTESFIPEALIAELVSGVEEQGEDFRIFNSYSAGNYLIWNDIPCFIDSRQMPYVSNFNGGGSLDNYLELLHNDGFSITQYDEFFDKYDFTYVLVSDEFDISEYLIYRGDYECLLFYEDTRMSLWKKIAD